MDLKSLLDQMLKSGKEMAEKGRNMVEDTLVTKEDPNNPGKTNAGSGLMQGAAAAGLLALLLGTKGGRSVTGAGLKLGSLAAVGGLAYQMYNQWKQGGGLGGSNPQSAETALLESSAQEPSLDSEALLKAMVAAAKADGHVDQQEMEAIRSKLSEFNVGDDINRMIMQELNTPTDIKAVAALAKGDEKAALELYLVSSILVDPNNEAERSYLADLQSALGLPDDVVKMV